MNFVISHPPAAQEVEASRQRRIRQGKGGDSRERWTTTRWTQLENPVYTNLDQMYE